MVSEEVYGELQRYLLVSPYSGNVITGTGGQRKIRLQSSGQGKRGGARVIYYYRTTAGQCLMLMAYAKNEADDLTPQKKKNLKAVVDNGRGT